MVFVIHSDILMSFVFCVSGMYRVKFAGFMRSQSLKK